MPGKDAKNNLSEVLWLSVMIMAGLFLFFLMPEIHLGSFHLKKIDIVSDLRHQPPVQKKLAADTLSPQQQLKSEWFYDHSSITPMEDFSTDHKNLNHFFDALKKSNKRQVRIAFYGDSFIEGDIISASLRDTLQRAFGGRGVGLVPLAAETAGFRKSIKHTYLNWDTYSLLLSPHATLPIGISGYTYIPKENNQVTYQPGKVPPQENFKTIKVLYQNSGPAVINYSINDKPETRKSLDQSDRLRQLTIQHPDIQSIQFRINPYDGALFYGISFEDDYGVYVDNFSMRRNSGIALGKLSSHLMKQFNEYLDYKLIILQYGLNVASEADSTNYVWYTSKMIKVIHDLKEAFPSASFLLLSVSDRGVNKDGKVMTMEAIPNMRDMQRKIAKQSGIAFWDMFEAMGGRNSIIHYTEAEPPLASKDYTHLNHLGGIKVGRKLADALFYEINKHEKKSNIP
jgi:lysophospholipase L1-like esterase